MTSKFDASVSKMKLSFNAIAAAKKHTVILEQYVPVKNTGNARAATKTVTKNDAKAVVAKKAVVEYIRKPEGLQGGIIQESVKKPTGKKSKLRKLLRGKTVYDFTS